MAHAQKPDSVFRRNGRVHLTFDAERPLKGSRSEAFKSGSEPNVPLKGRQNVSNLELLLFTPISPPAMQFCPLKVKLSGASVQSTTGSRGVRISGSNAGYTMFRGSVKSTDYSRHSPVSPSLPLPCVTVCHNRFI